MTAICSGGGPSQARAGFGETVALTASAIGATLNNIPTPWAVAFAGALGLVTYDLSTFCTVDPPAVPTFTAADLTALVSLNDFDAFLTAQQKLRDLVGAYQWYNLCQCTSGVTPAPPTPPTAPTGAPQINPPGTGGSYPSGTPCQSFRVAPPMLSGSHTYTFGPYPLDGGTYGTVTAVNPTTPPTGADFTCVMHWLNASGTFLGFIFIETRDPLAGSSQFSAAGPAPNGATQFQFDCLVNTVAYGGSPFVADVEIYCGSTPGVPGNGVQPTPCPTDPFTALLLNQILQLVTLIQRELSPFSYITGPAHSGLSGTGTIAVQGILGLLANISVPSSTGEIVGTPNVRLPLGRVNMGTVDGYTDRTELVMDSQLILPSNAGLFTLVGYSLEPGVTMTLTEIVRES
jgi:hypothetical protein